MKEFFKRYSLGRWIGLAFVIIMTIVVTGAVVDITVSVNNMYLDICSCFVPREYAAALGVACIVLGWWSFYKWIDKQEHNDKETVSEE